MSARLENYRDCLAWLYGRNQFAIKLGLANMQALLAARGAPEAGQAYLHVAGTNGKGSVCTFLARLLPSMGYRRVGLYVSPHLVSFRERLTVNGEPVPQEWVCTWLTRALPDIERIGATYFEIVTAMAVEYFRECGCDIAVMETGLGGRLDATNCLRPRVSIITPVSLDHTAMLGDTVEKIWAEKAAILKPGVPIVVDQPRRDLWDDLERRAAAAGSPALNLVEFSASGPGSSRLEGPRADGAWTVRGRRGEYPLAPPEGGETTQVRNLSLALLGLEALQAGGLPPAPPGGFKVRRPHGRLQVLPGAAGAEMVLDGGHNPEAVAALVRFLEHNFPGRAVAVAASFMSDKDAASMSARLDAVAVRRFFIELPGNPRALTLAGLRQIRDARSLGPIWEPGSLPGFLRGEGLPAGVLPVVCGSFFLLGHAIPRLAPRYPELDWFKQFSDEFPGAPGAP